MPNDVLKQSLLMMSNVLANPRLILEQWLPMLTNACGDLSPHSETEVSDMHAMSRFHLNRGSSEDAPARAVGLASSELPPGNGPAKIK